MSDTTWVKRVTRLWRKVVPLAFNDPAGYYEIGGGWGTAIYFEKESAPTGVSRPERKVHGFQPWIPAVGDVLRAAMQSGRTGVYIFTEVRRCGDPHDMFFATVEWRGYEDELTMPAKRERKGMMFL